MNPLQRTQDQVAIASALVNNGAFTSNVIDTLGMSYGEFKALLGVTDIALTVFKVMESDVKTDAVTLGGTPTLAYDVVTKPTATDDGKEWIIGVDFKNPRCRYLQLQATAGNGTTGCNLSAVFVGRPDGNCGVAAADRLVADAEYF